MLGALSGVLLACSGAASPNATQDAGASEAVDASVPVLSWSPCFGTFDCATLETPRGDVGAEPVEIALVRHAASAAAPRLGVLLFNPGGPGVAVVDGFPATYGTLAALLGKD